MERVASTLLVGCCILSLAFVEAALAGDYSISVVNNIHKTNNNMGSPCKPVELSYVSGSSVSKAAVADGLASGQTGVLKVNGVSACSSLSVYAICHYYHSSYTNYGFKYSQGEYSTWVDESVTQSLPCNCKGAQIGLKVNESGLTATQALDIKCIAQ